MGTFGLSVNAGEDKTGRLGRWVDTLRWHCTEVW